MADGWLDAWLDYSRQLLTDGDHIARCDQLLGPEAVSRSDAPDLRWPGFVGESYRAGGLLVAALVHREFASGRPPLPGQLVEQFVEATRRWRDFSISDDEWLGAVRTFYEVGLTTHWNVGWLIRDLAKSIPISVSDIAYVNAARCQIVENPAPVGHARAKRSVAELCARDYPLRDLCAILRPRLVLLTSKMTWDAVPTGSIGVPTLVINQRRRTVAVPFEHGAGSLAVGTRASDWIGTVVEILSEGVDPGTER